MKKRNLDITVHWQMPRNTTTEYHGIEKHCIRAVDAVNDVINLMFDVPMLEEKLLYFSDLLVQSGVKPRDIKVFFLGVCPEACPARRAHLETEALETRRTRDETSISLCPVLSTCSLYWCAQALIDLLAVALAVASEPYT